MGLEARYILGLRRAKRVRIRIEWNNVCLVAARLLVFLNPTALRSLTFPACPTVSTACPTRAVTGNIDEISSGLAVTSIRGLEAAVR